MLGLERDDEQAPAEYLALLQEVDGAEIRRPGAARKRLPLGPCAGADERRSAGRLAEELVHRLLCRPCHASMVAEGPPNVNSGTIAEP